MKPGRSCSACPVRFESEAFHHPTKESVNVPDEVILDLLGSTLEALREGREAARAR
jgi:hypothetical protein